MSSYLETVNKKLIPNVKWYQNNEYVIMTFIDLEKILKNNIILNDSNIIFDVSNENSNYYINFEFSNNINSKESKTILNENSVKIILKKIETENWEYLTKDNLYKNNIKIDWNHWTTESDEEDNEDVQMDFQRMMESMGGIGNMNNLNEENNDEEVEDVNDEDESIEDDE